MLADKIAKKFLLFFVFIFLISTVFSVIQLSPSPHLISMTNFQASASDAIQLIDQVDQLDASILNDEEILQNEENNFQLSARSAFSIELNDKNIGKTLFEKNKDENLPIASLVKLMTALVVLENYNLDQNITISKSAMDQVGEQGELKGGQTLSVKNLLYIMLIESSNKSAFALSEVIGNDSFINLMNRNAEKIGLLNTYFDDVTGLNENSYSTANDLSKISSYLFLNYPLFYKIISLKEFDLYLDDGSFHHKLINTNELLGQSDVVGGKTGYTIAAKGCFMAIQEKSPKNYIIHIILGSEDRFLEMKKLINFLDYNYPVLALR